MNAIEGLEEDLRACGVGAREAGTVGELYARALASKAQTDWIELYVGVFAELNNALQRVSAPQPASFERLFRLINDDLGTQLFSAQARSELARRACGPRFQTA